MNLYLIRGEFLKSYELFCEMNTYVIIKINNKEFKSKISVGKGCNPIWN
jgi:Ca2+-dependent lipid-binding protein